jgi:hypothetical protein
VFLRKGFDMFTKNLPVRLGETGDTYDMVSFTQGDYGPTIYAKPVYSAQGGDYAPETQYKTVAPPQNVVTTFVDPNTGNTTTTAQYYAAQTSDMPAQASQAPMQAVENQMVVSKPTILTPSIQTTATTMPLQPNTSSGGGGFVTPAYPNYNPGTSGSVQNITNPWLAQSEYVDVGPAGQPSTGGGTFGQTTASQGGIPWTLLLAASTFLA